LKTIITHNGVFHADEVLAIALMTVFKERSYKVIRTRDPKILAETGENYFIDVGGVYDTTNRQFDHHQFDIGTENYGLSSAVLIWATLHKASLYPCISALVSEVDAQDTGIKRQEPNHFCNIISSFNTDDINGEAQEKAFNNAVTFTVTYVKNLLRKASKLAHQEAVAQAATTATIEGITFTFPKEWVPVSNFEGIADFMVSYDDMQNCWSVQQVSNDGDKPILLQDRNAGQVFVHKAGFIGKYNEVDGQIQVLVQRTDGECVVCGLHKLGTRQF